MRTLAASLLLCMLPACVNFDVRAYAGYQATKVRGDLGLSSSEVPGSPPQGTVDVRTSFGLEDTSGSLYLRGEGSAGIIRGTVSVFRFAQAGGGTLTADFGDLTVGTPVNSDVEIMSTKLAVTFDILDLSVFRLSPGLAVNLLELKTEVNATQFAARETVDVFAPVPMPFLQAEADLGFLAATLDLGAMKVDISDTRGTFIDVEALLRYRPMPHMEVYTGYRWISIDAKGKADDQRFDANIDLQGWMLGMGVTF